MRLKSGVKLLEEREGSGEPAKIGDQVVYNLKIYLNKGDEVPRNQRQTEFLPDKMIRHVDGDRLVDHQLVLGSREAIAGVEYALVGMRAESYRRVRVSPHLAYRDEGLGDLIPANAVLIIELWLRKLVARCIEDKAN
ncbi:MAG TPA: FKBP-type peptidyl-prolyl cis-trans isomerase [Candidatus Binatus sp.]|nr:FKBP-type peptidyl-prolyl cis-trans isomerase [Candidatus Binatus sp.]